MLPYLKDIGKTIFQLNTLVTMVGSTLNLIILRIALIHSKVDSDKTNLLKIINLLKHKQTSYQPYYNFGL